MKKLCMLLAVAAWALSSSPAPAQDKTKPKKRPNVIIILADDMDYNFRIKHVGVEKTRKY
jgi:hypothetical protein